MAEEQEPQDNEDKEKPASSSMNVAKEKQTKKRKREAQEDLLLEKAISCLEKGRNDSKDRDTDQVFADFIASELQEIKDSRVKRMTKWKIQNVLYEGLNFGTTGPWPPFNQYSSPYQCGASPSSSVQAFSPPFIPSSNISETDSSVHD